MVAFEGNYLIFLGKPPQKVKTKNLQNTNKLWYVLQKFAEELQNSSIGNPANTHEVVENDYPKVIVAPQKFAKELQDSSWKSSKHSCSGRK